MSTSPGMRLCAAAQTVDRVVASPMSSQFREILPRGITIADAPQVRTLAAALGTLPLMPPGLHCPAALGGEVLLRFAAGGQEFQAVRIQNSGTGLLPGSARSVGGRSPRSLGSC